MKHFSLDLDFYESVMRVLFLWLFIIFVGMAISSILSITVKDAVLVVLVMVVGLANAVGLSFRKVFGLFSVKVAVLLAVI